LWGVGELEKKVSRAGVGFFFVFFSSRKKREFARYLQVGGVGSNSW
jgi:hypothetical protein